MKQVVFLFFLLITGFYSVAKVVDAPTAKCVAARLFNSYNIKTDSAGIRLAYARTVMTNGQSTPVYYIFNYSAAGFVIVAAADNVPPVLAWSNESVFDTNNIPPNAADWLLVYEKEVNYAIRHKLTATETTAAAWANLLNKKINYAAGKGTSGVGPLIQTVWNQNHYYNSLCPYSTVAGQHALTGCVATVMSQLMKYWQWPAKGIGFHSYRDSLFGTLSADFGRTVYDWANMPNTISNNNTPIATLMYETGVSVNMEYGISASSSYVLAENCPIRNNAQFALINYFCYKPAMKALYRKDHNDADWISILKNEIDAGRPVIYNGANDSEGHSFIADGYNSSNYLHFNWGWGGSFNGYYSIDNIVPDSITFMQQNTILTGIEPDSARTLVMDDTIAPTAMIYQKQAFVLESKIINVNPQPFDGYLSAVLINDYYPFFSTTKSINNQHLNWGDSLAVSFQFDEMLPGSYHARLMYGADLVNLTSVDSTSEYFNNTPIVIYGDPTADHFTVFPNPAANYCYIDINNSKAIAYKLTDATGRIVQQETIDNEAAVVPIPVTSLESGVYIVELTTPVGKQVKKVSIVK